MDALGTVLSCLRVEGSVFSRAELAAPWGVRTRRTESAIFHVVVRGAGWARPELEPGRPEGRPLAWRSGDLLLFPHGHGHVLSDRPDTPAAPIASLSRPPGEDGLATLSVEGPGACTALLCGTLRFEHWAASMILPHLPPLLHASGGHGPTAAWMEATLRMLGSEMERAMPGHQAVISRLAEVLFVQAVRGWTAEAGAGSWLAGLEDPGLARALSAMHADPARPWTVARLAKLAGMSRSAFAARFSAQVGSSPVAHLTRWRMVLARQALTSTDAGLATIATEVGYGSEASFIRAFSRETGTTPARWRRQQAA